MQECRDALILSTLHYPDEITYPAPAETLARISAKKYAQRDEQDGQDRMSGHGQWDMMGMQEEKKGYASRRAKDISAVCREEAASAGRRRS